MKKVIINVVLVINFIIIYLLQTEFFSWFTIYGVMPNLFVILVLYIGLFMGHSIGITYGIVFGILLDILIGKKIGITSIGLGIVGVIVTKLDRNFSKDSRMTLMLMVIFTTAIYEIVVYLLNYILLDINVEVQNFIKILSIELIYNALITIIIYPIIQFTGHDVESQFKGNRILTRYF